MKQRGVGRHGAPLQSSARPAVLPYAQGSWGPAEAETLPGPHGWLLQTDDDRT
jgi:hypothetical protein